MSLTDVFLEYGIKSKEIKNMKKIAMVLMMVFGLSAAFAKPVDFETEEYYVVADDENVQKDFSGMDDLDIVATVVSCMPKKTGEYENSYVGLKVDKVNEMSKKYFNYFMYSKDETHFLVFQNLGDGRELILYYKLKK